MKLYFRFLSAAVAAVVSVACVSDTLETDNDIQDLEKIKLIFSASYDGGTKTQLVDGKDVWWTESDVISVNGEYFWSTNREPSPVADFEGEVTLADTYYAVYPAWNVWEWFAEGKIALIEVREGQNAINGTFDNEVNVSAARTSIDDLNLRFRNLLGYVAFTIEGADSDLKKLTVQTRAGEPLSGICALNWDGDYPALSICDDSGRPSVYLNFDEDKSGTFYIAMLPGTYSAGLTFRFEDERDRYAMMAISESVTLEAGQIKNIGVIGDLDFKEDHRMQLDRQKDALYHIYSRCNGDQWADNTNWCSDAPLEEWYGIEVNEMGYVTSIDLSSNNLTGDLNLNCASDFKYMDSFNFNDNAIDYIDVRGNGVVEMALFHNCCRQDLRVEGIAEVVVDDCDGMSGVSGECGSLVLKNCSFAPEGSISGMTAKDAYVYNCQMESCGITSKILVFEESSTYDTWYAYTEDRLEIVNSYCSTICGGDFMDDTDIILQNATLWRSNWDEYSLMTLNCTIKGEDWDELFDDEAGNDGSEQIVLMRLFNLANGSEWTDNTNWGSDKPLDEWYGITTDAEGYVTAIDLKGNGLSAATLILDFRNLSRLASLDISDNSISCLKINGNGELDEIELKRCVSESISVENIAKVSIVECDSLASISGSCTELLVKDCAFRTNVSTPFGIYAESAHILNCTMHSCGLNSDILVFEQSTTYDTWHCYTSSRLEIIDSYCATICGWDFDEDADIILENATLWRSDWNDESLVTLTCSVKGRDWSGLFE